MVRPVDFGFNDQTGQDNDFQQRPTADWSTVNARALAEFDAAVQRLRAEGVEVLVLEKNRRLGRETPDAVFPNNWFSTEHDGTLIFYPMLAENRRAEKRVLDVEALLVANGYRVRNLMNIGAFGIAQPALEGTGSMVIDHTNEVVYASESLRCDATQFDNFVQARRYREGVLFQTRGSTGRPIYHTNVMMSIGDGVAVLCAECIVPDDRRRAVVDRLRQTHDLIEISLRQMEASFCGNVLQLRDRADRRLVVMSETAYDGYTSHQRRRLLSHGRIVRLPIPTIEAIGGGSARCMLAEVFLPRIPLPDASGIGGGLRPTESAGGWGPPRPPRPE